MNDLTPPEKVELSLSRLRRPRVSDAEAIFEYGSDPVVAHFADWPVRTSVESLIQSLQERDVRWGCGSEIAWVITSFEEDRAIGGVSCEINAENAEIGFLLNQRYWGRGIVVEAATWLINWLLSIAGICSVFATCDPENSRSIRVLEKLGFTLEDCQRRAIVRPQISSIPRDSNLYTLSKSHIDK